MIRTRACDPCALRKAKCDRGSPCQRCSADGLRCTQLRKSSKPGPKGPWAGKKRAIAKSQNAPVKNSPVGLAEGDQPENLGPPTQDESNHDAVLGQVKHCLRIYRQHSYSLWPVVDVQNLQTRLHNHSDVAAYALGTALGAVMLDRIHHLQASNDADEYPELDSQRLASESETARMKGAYQESPSLDAILSSFFLHIHSANRGQMFKATLLLREAITMAQLLGLDQADHYVDRSATEVQDRLRIIRLLHITERGHATRFDLPCIFHLDARLPALHADENPFDLLPFLGMVQLFQIFGTAINSFELHDECHLLPAVDVQIKQIPQLLDHSPDSQLVDFLITKQWMRLILWRRAMFHVELSLNIAAESLSVFFPAQLAAKVAAHISTFPRGIVESHGLGMQMKLADIAISLADVLSCRSGNSEPHECMRVGSRDLLHYLAAFLTSIPNSVNPRLDLLQEKISQTGWMLPLKQRGSPGFCLQEKFGPRNGTYKSQTVATCTTCCGAPPHRHPPIEVTRFKSPTEQYRL